MQAGVEKEHGTGIIITPLLKYNFSKA